MKVLDHRSRVRIVAVETPPPSILKRAGISRTVLALMGAQVALVALLGGVLGYLASQ